MTQKFRDEDADVLRFGGGINSRASEGRIHPLECTSGENFILDPGNGEFRRRPPYDLVGTVPNTAEIRGFATLRKADGTVSMLVQAGATVYEWNGVSTFTSRGSVSASAKLRGPIEANWILGDRVLIGDINLAEEIHEWNGTTFSQTAFLQSDGSSPFGNFRAKHIVVENERAFYGNIHDNGTNFPHLLVSSERGNYLIVSSSDRPSSGLGAAAPWFLPTPQLKPINGLAFAFNILAISQDRGAFEKLTGSNAQNFAIDKLHHGSGASGDESVVSTGNDIIYGGSGTVESLLSTDKFGDVEFDDLSFKIQPDVKSYTGWTLVHNPRLNRVYCFPDNQSEVWVLHTDFIGTELSPWAKWTTRHSLNFQPTAVMMCFDPSDGLEYVFMGDGNGNLYRLEGTGTLGDAGETAVIAKRESVLFDAKLDAKAWNIHGWLQHRKRLSNTAKLRFLFAGEHVHDARKEIALSALTFDTVYNDAVYYGGNFFYGVPQENRLVRRIWAVPGESNQFQIELTIDGLNDFSITELGFRYDISA